MVARVLYPVVVNYTNMAVEIFGRGAAPFVVGADEEKAFFNMLHLGNQLDLIDHSLYPEKKGIEKTLMNKARIMYALGVFFGIYLIQ